MAAFYFPFDSFEIRSLQGGRGQGGNAVFADAVRSRYEGRGRGRGYDCRDDSFVIRNSGEECNWKIMSWKIPLVYIFYILFYSILVFPTQLLRILYYIYKTSRPATYLNHSYVITIPLFRPL